MRRFAPPHSVPLSEHDRAWLDRAVAEAGDKTRVRIVPVLATSSGRYDRGEDLVGVVTGLLAAVGVWLLLPDAEPNTGSWAGYSTGQQLAWAGLAFLGGLVVGVVVAGRVWGLRRLMTPRRLMRETVRRAAEYQLLAALAEPARNHDGVVVLYVSLFERRAVLLADPAVTAAVGREKLNQWCTRATEALGRHTLTDAMVQSVARLAEGLAQSVPPNPAANRDSASNGDPDPASEQNGVPEYDANPDPGVPDSA